MSKIVLTTLLAISLTGLATMATPAASAVWCGPTTNPTLAPVVQKCDDTLRTASDTLGPYLDEVDSTYQWIVDQLP
jgi:hypothetical protein